MDYFISDTHMGHTNILTFERIRFKTIEEHDNFIWDMLKKLTDKDRLFHLGDVGILDENTISKWKSLKCKTILIRGNHDTQANKLREAFDEVHNEPIFYHKRILLSHEPLPVTNGTLNVHGHLHGSKLNKSNYLNISFAVGGYKLFTEKELRIYLTILPKDNFKFLHEWYAKDYYFLIPNKDVVFNDDGTISLEKSRELLKVNKRKRKE